MKKTTKTATKTTNWDILIKDNLAALVGFASGASLRKAARSFKSADARAEMWDLERSVDVETARKRAKNALSRRKISVK